MLQAYETANETISLREVSFTVTNALTSFKQWDETSH